jgi:octaprenyl-diphosphate synthase
MSASLEAIKKPIEKELNAFEVMFKQSMKTRVSLLDIVLNYILKRKGKQIRPLFVMYTAKLFGDINIRTYRGASLVELLHTATLVHDDVVDESYLRRGFFSINALWKNKVAVLVGDYLLSRGLLLAVEHRDFDMLEVLSNAVKDMSEGELLQLERARFMNATEEVYFQIIKQNQPRQTVRSKRKCVSLGSRLDSLSKFGTTFLILAIINRANPLVLTSRNEN